MFPRNILIAITISLTCTGVAVGQDGPSPARGQAAITPEMLERAQQRRKMLEHPDFIKLGIAPDALESERNGEGKAEPHKAGDKISFRLMMTNTLFEPFYLSIALDPYVQDRPYLYRDGELVPYREDVAKLIKNRDKYPSAVSSSIYSARLEPNKAQPAVIIDFSHWYAPLEPGHYQLSIRHRFIVEGEWIESPAITFEVVPK